MKRLLTPLRHAAKSMAEITRVWYQIPLSPSGRLPINPLKKTTKKTKKKTFSSSEHQKLANAAAKTTFEAAATNTRNHPGGTPARADLSRDAMGPLSRDCTSAQHVSAFRLLSWRLSHS